jgi:hypothetical protein
MAKRASRSAQILIRVCSRGSLRRCCEANSATPYFAAEASQDPSLIEALTANGSGGLAKQTAYDSGEKTGLFLFADGSRMRHLNLRRSNNRLAVSSSSARADGRYRRAPGLHYSFAHLLVPLRLLKSTALATHPFLAALSAAIKASAHSTKSYYWPLREPNTWKLTRTTGTRLSSERGNDR